VGIYWYVLLQFAAKEVDRMRVRVRVRVTVSVPGRERKPCMSAVRR
jgi:hypothetical protein